MTTLSEEALERHAERLLDFILSKGYVTSREIVRALTVATSYAYTVAREMVRKGFLIRVGRGVYVAGPRMFQLACRKVARVELQDWA